MSDFQKFCLAFWVVVGISLAGGFAFKFGQKRGYSRGYEEAIANIKPDTEYVEKKIYIDKPVPVEVKPSGVEMYPVGTLAQMQHILDSLSAIRPDTTFIEIPVPIETKLFRDEKDSTYEAQVSGYRASLDWIKVNQKTAYITVPVPEYKYPTFALSPTVDALILPDSYAAGAGLELDFWINRWQFTGGGGYALEISPGQRAFGWYGKGSIKYNLIRK